MTDKPEAVDVAALISRIDRYYNLGKEPLSVLMADIERALSQLERENAELSTQIDWLQKRNAVDNGYSDDKSKRIAALEAQLSAPVEGEAEEIIADLTESAGDCAGDESSTWIAELLDRAADLIRKQERRIIWGRVKRDMLKAEKDALRERAEKAEAKCAEYDNALERLAEQEFFEDGFSEEGLDPKSYMSDDLTLDIEGRCDLINVNLSVSEVMAMSDWIKTNDPVSIPENVAILGWRPEWIDEDFNPDGIRECFLGAGGWISSYWFDYQDCWETDTDSLPPLYWMRRPVGPVVGGDGDDR